LEGGAEEFLLKPLQLSDLDKLQSYFVKSLENSCEEESDHNSCIDSENENVIINISSSSNSNHNNNSNNSNSKRKAISAESHQERSRPKMKELAVV